MTSKWKWFAIKTLYKITVSGKAKKKDDCYDDSNVLIEERTLLFKAGSEDEAFNKAIKEGSNYAKNIEYINVYGQKVKAALLKGLDVFELHGKPDDGMEVFNETRLANKEMKDDEIIETILDQQEDVNEVKKRKIFIKKEIAEVIF